MSFGETFPALGIEVWMAPGTRTVPPPEASDPSLEDAWQRPMSGAALSEDGMTAPTVEGADETAWRRPEGG